MKAKKQSWLWACFAPAWDSGHPPDMLWSASGRSSGVLLEISGIPLGRFLGFLEPLVVLSGSLLLVFLVVNLCGVPCAHGARMLCSKNVLTSWAYAK